MMFRQGFRSFASTLCASKRLLGLQRSSFGAFSSSMPRKSLFTVAQSDVNVVRVKGEDAAKFLQGITTNDVPSRLGEPGQAAYTTFLNSKGRVQWDSTVFVEEAPGAGPSYLMTIPAPLYDRAMKILKLLRLRSKVQFEGPEVHGLGAVSIVPETLQEFMEWSSIDKGSAVAGMDVDPEDVFPDPRDVNLGYIGFLPKGVVEANEEWNSATKLRWYNSLRMLAGAPTGLEVEGSVALEWNLEQLKGIHFHKGCYVGQELMARTHFQGLLRKRAVPVLFLHPHDNCAGDAVSSEDVATLASYAWWVSANLQKDSAKAPMSLAALRPCGGDLQWKHSIAAGADILPHNVYEEAAAAAASEEGSEAPAKPSRRRRRNRTGGSVIAVSPGTNLGLATLRIDNLVPALKSLAANGTLTKQDASDASYHFTIPSSGSCDSARIEPLVATTESGDMVYAVPLLPKYWVEIAMKMRWTNSEEEGNA